MGSNVAAEASASFRQRAAVQRYLTDIDQKPVAVVRRRQFDSTLRNFYRSKWNCNFKPPMLNGRVVNLYDLYAEVQERGGYAKVSNRDEWLDVAAAVGYSRDVEMIDNAMKVFYMRYLSKYEEVETVGDIDEHDLDVFGKRRTLFASTECPLGMSQRGMCDSRDYDGQAYSQLIKSLYSGLPNEVDFAFNAIIIGSAPGDNHIELQKVPLLLPLIVAHAGVYGSDEVLQSVAKGWREFCDHKFDDFWRNAGIRDEDVLALIPLDPVPSTSDEFFVPPEMEFSVKHPALFRVSQAIGVLRNFSFEYENHSIMAKCQAVINFIAVCASSKFVSIANDAFDTLCNIGSEVDLMTKDGIYINCLLLKVVCDALQTEDKARVLHALEIIAALCQNQRNETVCAEFIDRTIIERLFCLATVKDVLICIYTLETLYQFTELGRSAVKQILMYPACIDLLISFITSEAAAFGRTGLSGIHVVDNYAGTAHSRPGHFPPMAGQPHNMSHPLPGFRAAQMGSFASPTYPATRRPLQHHAASPMPPPQFAQMSQDEKVRTLTAKWIREHCVSDVDGTVGRGEVYSAYVDHMRLVHQCLSGSVQLFTALLKSIYPSTEVVTAPNNTLIRGIRYMATPPAPPASSTASSSSVASSHPLMQKILASTPKAEPVAAPTAPSTAAALPNGVPEEPTSSSTSLVGSGDVSSKEASPAVEKEPPAVPAAALPVSSEQVKLEVCAEAVAACSIISPVNEQHETQIIRIENTAASAKAEENSLPGPASTTASDEPASTASVVGKSEKENSQTAPVVNGRVSHQKAPASNATADGEAEGENAADDEEMEVDEEDASEVDQLSAKKQAVHAVEANGIASPKHEQNGLNGTMSPPKPEQDVPKMNGAPAAEETNAHVGNGVREVEGKPVSDEQPRATTKEERLNDAVNSVCSEMTSSAAADPPPPNGAWKSPRQRKGKETGADKTVVANGTPATKRRRQSTTPRSKGGKRARASGSADADEQQHVDAASRPSSCKSQGAVTAITPGVPSTSTIDFMCEWDACGSMFQTADEVISHHVHKHITPENCDAEGLYVCMWPSCDSTRRGKWSVITHLQDHHCPENNLRSLAIRRNEIGGAQVYLGKLRQQIAEKLRDPKSLVNFAPAVDVIKRHVYATFGREITDDQEGPVTKAIRLTAALVLRNIARYSDEGRSLIRRHESFMSVFACSRLEASSALLQCLTELYPPSPDDPRPATLPRHVVHHHPNHHQQPPQRLASVDLQHRLHSTPQPSRPAL